MLKSVLALAMLLLAGCASLPSGKADPRDPWERFNRSTFAFNDAMDRAIARPVAKAYKKVMPRFVRAGVNNVFNNLNTVNTAVNDALQGKMRAAGHDSTRFLMNTVFGFGGLFDPATRAGIEMNDEDFGQTFGKWGMKSGPYLVLPILGPSSARDTFGKLVDQFTYPVSYLEDDSTRFYIRLVSLLDTRTELLDLDALGPVAVVLDVHPRRRLPAGLLPDRRLVHAQTQLVLCEEPFGNRDGPAHLHDLAGLGVELLPGNLRARLKRHHFFVGRRHRDRQHHQRRLAPVGDLHLLPVRPNVADPRANHHGVFQLLGLGVERQERVRRHVEREQLEEELRPGPLIQVCVQLRDVGVVLAPVRVEGLHRRNQVPRVVVKILECLAGVA